MEINREEIIAEVKIDFRQNKEHSCNSEIMPIE